MKDEKGQKREREKGGKGEMKKRNKDVVAIFVEWFVYQYQSMVLETDITPCKCCSTITAVTGVS